MRKILIIILILLLFFTLTCQATISITFDDAFETVFTKAFPIMEKYIIKGTVFMTTNNIGKDKYLSRRQLQVLSEHGWSIQSHTVSHPFLPLVRFNPFDSIIDELYKPKLILENITRTPVIGFASPYGFYDSWSLQYIKHFYKYHRTTNWGINKPPYDFYHLKSVMPTRDTKLSTFKNLIKQSPNKLLIFTFHDFDNCWQFSYSSKKFQKLIQFIAHNYQTSILYKIRS